MTQVRHKDKITDQTEEQWLSEHIFEHNGFHIDTPGSYIQAEPTLPIKKFKSTQEIAEKIKKFIVDSKKLTPEQKAECHERAKWTMALKDVG